MSDWDPASEIYMVATVHKRMREPDWEGRSCPADGIRYYPCHCESDPPPYQAIFFVLIF